MLLRILLFTFLAVVIYLGVRRIWKDWSGKINGDAERAKQLRRERDKAERSRPDVIELEQDRDGTYRPKGKDDQR
ncbi:MULTISPECIES: hypothetical protein [unclassified Devosia]|uniref:hypothetical protein n=1 Tax=unclassified Devosia TaxID=196773 RepID=UPI00145E9EF2|nr:MULTISPECIES: hypothetical protein [unclassified Devosia]MBJ6988238.1 hypothetical protein [Devosia sp. MC521]MBJ7577596.1 hypothetical protein [Devosia sp. MC532]MBK1794495.1 hypothetical protein [Devosia sp. WQ 349K1]QMW63247.1 hypothetical protein H4N61_02565 [Devosia sp. MC521]